MQLPLFQETIAPDTAALRRCLQADTVAIDVETETRWSGRGPRIDFGLSYPADVTVIALAWLEDGKPQTTAVAAPFDGDILTFLKTLFRRPITMIAHNAVFDFR